MAHDHNSQEDRERIKRAYYKAAQKMADIIEETPAQYYSEYGTDLFVIFDPIELTNGEWYYPGIAQIGTKNPPPQ